MTLSDYAWLDGPAFDWPAVALVTLPVVLLCAVLLGRRTWRRRLVALALSVAHLGWLGCVWNAEFGAPAPYATTAWNHGTVDLQLDGHGPAAGTPHALEIRSRKWAVFTMPTLGVVRVVPPGMRRRIVFGFKTVHTAPCLVDAQCPPLLRCEERECAIPLTLTGTRPTSTPLVPQLPLCPPEC